ncbi:unnamed protein product, partial [Plutella xylostella]
VGAGGRGRHVAGGGAGGGGHVRARVRRRRPAFPPSCVRRRTCHILATIETAVDRKAAWPRCWPACRLDRFGYIDMATAASHDHQHSFLAPLPGAEGRRSPVDYDTGNCITRSAVTRLLSTCAAGQRSSRSHTTWSHIH